MYESYIRTYGHMHGLHLHGLHLHGLHLHGVDEDISHLGVVKGFKPLPIRFRLNRLFMRYFKILYLKIIKSKNLEKF